MGSPPIGSSHISHLDHGQRCRHGASLDGEFYCRIHVKILFGSIRKTSYKKETGMGTRGKVRSRDKSWKLTKTTGINFAKIIFFTTPILYNGEKTLCCSSDPIRERRISFEWLQNQWECRYGVTKYTRMVPRKGMICCQIERTCTLAELLSLHCWAILRV